MTPQELFDMLMAYPQPTRTEILTHIEVMTRKYEPEWVEALLADFADMLFQWQCVKTYDRAKREYDERERQHRAEYDERYSAFEVRLNFANYALATGTKEPIEWPEEPEPYEPLPFIPPMPGTTAENIHIPAMYSFAIGLLKRKTSSEADKLTDTLHLPSELDTDRAIEYFARAIGAGYMKANENNAQWLKSGAQLGYVCSKIYSQPRPIASLEKYFRVTKLSAAITQASYEAKRDDVKNWRAEIDRKIFFD